MLNEDFDIYKLLPGLEPPCDTDERVSEPIERLPFTRSLPDLRQAETVFSPPVLANTVSSPLTEEDAAIVDILFHILPPDFIASLEAMDGALPGLAPEPPTTPSTITTTPSVSNLPVSSASIISPTTSNNDPSVSPPAHERRSSVMNSPNQSEDPSPGPSAPQPAKRRNISHPGRSAVHRFHPIIPPPERSNLPDEPDYFACQCPGGPTTKPWQHWRAVCPSNPDGGQRPFICEICGDAFTAKYNKDRHVRRLHP